MHDGRCEAVYTQSLLGACKVLDEAGIQYDYITLSGDCFVDRARNRLVRRFLDSDSSHIMFIDSDLGFDCDAIAKLYRHNLSVIGGVYRKKVERVEYPCSVNTGLVHDCLLSANMLPGGFLMINRMVFETLDVPTYEYDGETIQEFFSCGNRESRFKGEDVEFSRLLLENGHPMWIEPNINFIHEGRKSYRGNFLDDCCEITE